MQVLTYDEEAWRLEKDGEDVEDVEDIEDVEDVGDGEDGEDDCEWKGSGVH